jgi:hypothetical protein
MLQCPGKYTHACVKNYRQRFISESDIVRGEGGNFSKLSSKTQVFNNQNGFGSIITEILDDFAIINVRGSSQTYI